MSPDDQAAALVPGAHSTLTLAGVVLAVVLVAGSAGFGLMALAASVAWWPVTLVAGLLGAVLLLAACLALAAAVFLLPAALAMAVAGWSGQQSA